MLGAATRLKDRATGWLRQHIRRDARERVDKVGVRTDVQFGDLLGHRTLESTCVYLRLQTATLRDVALPLPAPIGCIEEAGA